MNKRNASQSSLFLIELIFVIFFFSLTSMLCVQVFVKDPKSTRLNSSHPSSSRMPSSA